MRHLNLFLLFLGFLAVIAGCGKKQETKLTSVGVMQFVTNPFSEQSIAGVLKAIEDAGYQNGENIYIEVKNAQGDFPTVSAITQKFKSVSSRVLRKEFPELSQKVKKHLWAPSCYHGSVG